MTYLASAIFGTLPNWLTFIAVVGAALALRGGQLGPAVGYLRDANQTLTEEVTTLTAELRERDRMILELHNKTDLEPMQAALIASMQTHEERAAARHVSMLAIMDLIAARLGPNGE